MKKLTLLLTILLLLAGCGERRFVVVTPHNEDYVTVEEGDDLVVSSYLGLKSALLALVEDCQEEGTIRTEGYAGDIGDDLSQAVYEVSRSDPLGAFAVDYMTYDYSRIVSYYELHIHTTFRRSREEIASVQYATSLTGFRSRVANAMRTYAPVLRVRLGGYAEFDLEDLVETIYYENPSFALEKPAVSMEIYPDSGAQRILEVAFDYQTPAAALEADQEALAEKVAAIGDVYWGENAQMSLAGRLYARLISGGELLSPVPQEDWAHHSAYGAVVVERADSYGYAMAFTLLCTEKNISCQVVSGRRGSDDHCWCYVELDGAFYYVDPAMGLTYGAGNYFLLGDAELTALGYTWDQAAYSPVTLDDDKHPNLAAAGVEVIPEPTPAETAQQTQEPEIVPAVGTPAPAEISAPAETPVPDEAPAPAETPAPTETPATPSSSAAPDPTASASPAVSVPPTPTTSAALPSSTAPETSEEPAEESGTGRVMLPGAG